MIERYSLPRMSRIWELENKYATWLQVEIAVCEAWAELGVIPQEAVEKIKAADIRIDVERFLEIEKEVQHDVIAFIKGVTEQLGEEGKYIHYGMTSYDVVDTALSLLLSQAIEVLREDLEELAQAIRERAVEHKYTLMMGRTHGVHAEPVTFGLKLLVWLAEVERHLERLRQAQEMTCVGKISGAVGTYAHIDPQVERLVCAKLGLRPPKVTTQILSRDRHAHFIMTLALIASSLEKFATEIRNLQRTEILEVEEPFRPGQRGSSAMPHKRNPILCERITGLARVMRSYVMPALENVVTWHERDLANSSSERIIIPDACILLDYMLHLMTQVVREMRVYPEAMRRNVEVTQGVIFSQQVMLRLVEKGMSREAAYRLVQEHSLRAWEERRPLLELLREDGRVREVLSEEELQDCFNYEPHLRHVDAIFARFGL